jgi:hypothetical protein
MKIAYVSPLGLEVSKGDWEEARWTITGYPKKSSTGLEFDSAYAFEEYIQKKVRCEGIDFDSETCQFFAYAKTEKRAKSFVEDLEKWFKSIL